jgi:hypothetical protein
MPPDRQRVLCYHPTSRSSSHEECIIQSHLLPHLHNRLQLPRVTKRVLNDLIARNEDVLAQVIVLLLGEVYPAVLYDPPALLSELDDAAF